MNKLCDECETVAHCLKHGCIPKQALAAPVQENAMIYKTFEQWKSGNVLEHGVPRTEYYSEDQLDLVEMGWNYGYDAGRAVEQALDKKAENARELGLDYEPVGLIDRLTNPEQHYEFTDPKKANAVLMSLCQEAADALAAPVEPVACVACEGNPKWGNIPCEVCGTTPPAQPAVQEGRDWSLLEATQESLREHMAEIKRLKAAQPAVPDAIGPNEDELPAYAAGWNDCRQAMLEMMK